MNSAGNCEVEEKCCCSGQKVFGGQRAPGGLASIISVVLGAFGFQATWTPLVAKGVGVGVGVPYEDCSLQGPQF